MSVQEQHRIDVRDFARAVTTAEHLAAAFHCPLRWCAAWTNETELRELGERLRTPGSTPV